MRSDALGEVAQFEGLPEVLNRSQYLVPRMTRDQMQAAIEGPAALTDTSIAPDVLQGLLAEAAQGQDQLPLLQHLLMRLWEKRRRTEDGGWQITSAEFETLKGPAEALDEHAEQVLAELQSEARRNLARLIFQQLTEVSQGREQRRPARLSKLTDLTGRSPEEVRAVADHFFSASLLTSPDRGRVDDWEVDITHECLIRQWTRLRDWVKAEAEDREEFLDFVKKGERRHLLSGTDLDPALRWRKNGHTAAWAERYGGDLQHTLGFIDRSRRTRLARRLIVAGQEWPPQCSWGLPVSVLFEHWIRNRACGTRKNSPASTGRAIRSLKHCCSRSWVTQSRSTVSSRICDCCKMSPQRLFPALS